MSFLLVQPMLVLAAQPTDQLSGIKRDQKIADFRAANVYSDAQGNIIGAKFFHIPTGSPVFVLQIETVPQVFLWIDEPSGSDKGLAHSLEHLVYGKGVKGRYARLLTDMKLGSNTAFTQRDYNAYHFYSGGSTDDLLEQLRAWMDTLFHPDFTDVEAEREFYSFGTIVDPGTGKKTLAEKGTVYNEMNARSGLYTYYYELRKQVYGPQSPLGFDSGGVPAAMRGVTPADIREFHAKYYSLGPQTGFIFALAPKNDAFLFLRKLSRELRTFTVPRRAQSPISPGEPKYPILSASGTEIGIYPFPRKSPQDPGEIFLGWKPQKAESLADLYLLELLVEALGEGEQSLLHKALIDRKTRVVESGATSVSASLSTDDGSWFPALELWVEGIQGNRITPDLIEQLRTQVKKSLAEIAAYPAHSPQLLAFNQLVASHDKSNYRFETIWIRNAPQFGLRQTSSFWKERLEFLELDPAFNRSLSQERVEQVIRERLASGENIWAAAIQKFRLLETPYATASKPSPELLERQETERQERVAAKIKQLMQHYHTNDDQQALTAFEEDEQAKTKEVEAIEARVPRPKFMSNPPMTPDEGIHYQQSNLLELPVITTTFDRPPTIDVGLNFDLRHVPRKYYKYLPLLPRFIDGVGLKEGERTLSYSEVLEQLERDIYQFSIAYETNPLSRRADLSVRASAANEEEFRTALSWMGRLLQFNDLNLSNLDRLRDIVDRAVTADDFFTRQAEEFWISDLERAFRYQHDALYLALRSHYTQAHWRSRMKWMLHKPVPSAEIDGLGAFASQTLSSWDQDKPSREGILQKLQALNRTGLEGELVEYWKKNLPAFPEGELVGGLRQLAAEVQEDLKTGPQRTIEEIKDLQRLVIDRAGLHLDLNLSEAALKEIKPDLLKFLQSISVQRHDALFADAEDTPAVAKLRQRYPDFQGAFPYYVGLVNLDGVSGNTVFTAQFPGYSDLDRQSLLEFLGSQVRGGGGPESLYMKTWEAGLAYGNGIRAYPESKIIRYYADRTPSIPALVELVNSLCGNLGSVGNDSILDYVFAQAFSYSRAMLTFSQRGAAMAADLRDGRNPEQVRHFREGLLKLKQDPNLLEETIKASLDAAGLVLLKQDYQEKQKVAQSIFFMIGPENLLSQAEQKLSIPELLRMWPSDYWIQ